MCTTTQLDTLATNVDITNLNGERIIDFDIDANTNYEIQSSIIADADDQVIEASVRFGRVEERPQLAIGKSILYTAWTTMANSVLDAEAVEADLSHFAHIVPHLRVERQAVEDGLETVTVQEFIAAVAELAELVEDVLRGSDTTIDARIDDYL